MLRRLVPVLFVLAILAITVVVAIAADLRSPGLGRPAPAGALIGVTWHWTSTTVAAAVTSATPDPSRYTVEFDPDRTIRAKADCNTVSGRYRVIPGGRTGPQPGLVVSLGSTSLADCGADSLSAAYIAGLEAAASYFIADGQLTIGLAAGGSMTFR